MKATSIREYMTNPNSFTGIGHIPEVMKSRALLWVLKGLIKPEGESELMQAFDDGLEGPASSGWVKSFAALGDKYIDVAHHTNEEASKKEMLELASFYLYLARWPHYMSPEAHEAYKKQVKVSECIGAMFDEPIEAVSFEHEGNNVVGHFRKPEGEGGYPLILVSPGIDDWKGEMEEFITPMIKAGFATFVIDAPGTGENTVLFTPGSHKVFSSALDIMVKRNDVDESRMGFWSLSGGGHSAVAMALCEPRLRASVNLGGFVHLTFNKEWFYNEPESIMQTFATQMGINTKDKNYKVETIEKLMLLSLETQGLFVASPKNTPLLSINGTGDVLVDPKEYEFIADQGVPQDYLMFHNNPHVAPQNIDIHHPFAISWLAKHLR